MKRRKAGTQVAQKGRMELQEFSTLKTMALEGLVMACDWDEKGNAVDIKLCMAGEKELFITNTPTAKKLFNHLKEWVRVVGDVFEDGNKNFVNVKKIKNKTTKVGENL